jgi:recombination protein RecA
MSKDKKMAALQTLVKSIAEKYTPEGATKPVIAFGSDLTDRRFIPCATPALGYLIGTGGWPQGQLIEFFGKEHAGKTTLMNMALKDCLDFERANGGTRVLAVIDIEHRFNPDWAKRLGLTPDEDIIIVQPSNAETATDIMTKLIKSKQICAIGFDSIGAAATANSQQEFAEKGTLYGGNANVMKRNVQTVAPLANLFDVTIFYLNQLRADMSGYNRAMTPGGHAVKHQMSLRVYIRPGRSKYFDKTGKAEVQVGFPMVFKTVKNTFGPFGREQWSDFYFVPNRWLDHVGFDVERDYARLGLLLNVVEQRGGGYYLWRDMKERGRDTFFEALKTRNLLQEFITEVQGAFSREISQSVQVDDDDILLAPEADGPDDVDDET